MLPHPTGLFLFLCIFPLKVLPSSVQYHSKYLGTGATSRVRGSVCGDPQIKQTKCPALRVTLFIPLLICPLEPSTFPNSGEFLAPK